MNNKLSTEEYRQALENEGRLAGEWKDKPYRLVYDLCNEIDSLRGYFIKFRTWRWVGEVIRQIEKLESENARLKTAIEKFGNSSDFDWNILERIDQLEQQVANYPRDHEAEDADEPITDEWLRSVGFDNCRPCHVWGTPDTNWYNKTLGIEIWNSNDTGDWLWVEFDSVPMRTRQDLRFLAKWVGIKSLKN